MEMVVNKGKMVLVRGDITRQDTEAIVNAANSSLLGGAGVDGAIHRAGGPEILEECKQIRARHGGCPPGEAVITTGGDLPAMYVIHTVGPVWRGGNAGEEQTLKNCYLNSLKLALENHISTIAFPSVSTGAYGYPIEKACPVAVKTVAGFLAKNDGLKEVRFILFSGPDYRQYVSVLSEFKAT